MDNSGECCCTQLIDGDGAFNVDGLENFINEVKLRECGLSYAIVSILGPLCSGKSTLLNHLFGTNFREMDAFKGRSQTTKGIWMAKAGGIEPCMLVMDLEGTDGKERGENDTSFEKQSALFALAVSDIVLINMWCHAIGCEQAANWPLLKTVFQVMMRLFSSRKTTLVFVIRDKTTRIPLKNLESVLREDVQKIWENVPKPQAHKETPFSEFFNVEVVALSSYEEKEEQFKEQVASFRQQFFHSNAHGGLAGARRGVVPASGFSFSAQQIWKVIKESKDLELPAQKVMAATVRCEVIAHEKYSSFTENEDWHLIEEAAQLGPVPGFGKKISSILEACLSEYESEAVHLDEVVRSMKRKQLEERSLRLVQPAFQAVVGHIWHGSLDKFKEEFDNALNGGEGFSVAARDCAQSNMALFDKRCADVVIEQAKWDTSRVREKLRSDIDAHVASVRAAKLSELTKVHKARLKEALSGPVEALLKGGDGETWSAIRKLLSDETQLAITRFSGALYGFEMDEQSKEKLLAGLKDHARGVIERTANKVSRGVLTLMKDRFTILFGHDADFMQRVWTRTEDVRAIARCARWASLRLLSVMAAVRLDGEMDNIDGILSVALLDNKPYARVDPLVFNTWEEIPSSKTLITPVQCKSLWRQFTAETRHIVNQAIAAQARYLYLK